MFPNRSNYHGLGMRSFRYQPYQQFGNNYYYVMVERLFLAVPRGNLRFVIVVFPDQTHLLFFMLIL